MNSCKAYNIVVFILFSSFYKVTKYGSFKDLNSCKVS